MKAIILLILCALVTVSVAGAHVGGFTYEVTVNNYFVDIGASKLTLPPNELTLFEYNLYPTSDPNNLADFDSVYVTISDEQTGVVYAGLIHKLPENISVMSYAFPKAGNYSMSARFDKAGTVLAEADFKVPVGVEESSADDIVKIVAFVLIIAGAVFWFLKHTKNRPTPLGGTEAKSVIN